MGKRGKPSAASLEVVRQSTTTALDRPECSPELTVAEQNEWVAIVNRMPADWFPRETHGMLAQYCRHVVNARRIAELVEHHVAGDPGSDNWVADYDRLLKMQEREGRAISSLATRMRMSQHSRTSKGKSRGTSRTPPHLS